MKNKFKNIINVSLLFVMVLAIGYVSQNSKSFFNIPIASARRPYPVINDFTADPNPVNKNSPTTLSWDVSYATYCEITGPGVNVTGTLNSKVTPPLLKTSTYHIVCGDANSGTSPTIKACYLGTYPQGDINHPLGGSVTYINSNNVSTTDTGVYNDNVHIVNYLQTTTPSAIDASSVSCSTAICDPIAQCCYRDTTTGNWVPGPPCA